MLYTWWNAHRQAHDMMRRALTIDTAHVRYKWVVQSETVFALLSQLDSPLFQRLNTQV